MQETGPDYACRPAGYRPVRLGKHWPSANIAILAGAMISVAQSVLGTSLCRPDDFTSREHHPRMNGLYGQT